MADNPQERNLLKIVEKWATPPAETVSRLPKPTKKDNAKGRCSECGGWHGLPAVHLDYMGHADVTLALIQEDPLWTWEPMSYAPDGSPTVVPRHGADGGIEELELWVWLTVHGVRRPAVGTVAPKEGASKELIGDALRNGAMRFGIGTNLWSKSEASERSTEDARSNRPPSSRSSQEGALEPPPGAKLRPAWVRRINDRVAEVAKVVGLDPLEVQDKVLIWCDARYHAANPWMLTEPQATELGGWLAEWTKTKAQPVIDPDDAEVPY